MPECALPSLENQVAFAQTIHVDPPARYQALVDDWYTNAPPVCGSDAMSQIAWLKANATPAFSLHALLAWNWDRSDEVLRWFFYQRKTPACAVAYQLTNFVCAGSAGVDPNARTDMMAAVAAKLRLNFFKTGIGLPVVYRIAADDFEKVVAALPHHNVWRVPQELLSPSGDPLPEPDIMFDDDGAIRPTMQAWKNMHPDRFGDVIC